MDAKVKKGRGMSRGLFESSLLSKRIETESDGKGGATRGQERREVQDCI